MPFIYVDRRKAGKDKSAANRQRLLKRIRTFVKNAAPQSIGQNVSGQGSSNTSPVKVAGSALEEPRFAYAQPTERTLIIIGNDEYNRGDIIPIPEGEMGEGDGEGGRAGDGENGEDSFVINVAKDEFLDLFFEDCELPNLTNEKFTDKLDTTFQPAGFSTSGSPSQLSIIRTYKQSLGRRFALKGPYEEEREALEKELADIYDDIAQHPPEDMVIQKWSKRIDEIEARLGEIQTKMIFLDGFDKSDLRYRRKEAKPLKTVDAVLLMLMDISGSMDEEKKTTARRWFALLYAFIKRRYGSADLIFLAHTTVPMEMPENEFFTTRVNGGTEVSPALVMANQIIDTRYDHTQTNIYLSHGSDGDNWANDNDKIEGQMLGENGLMSKIQMFSYVEVGKRATGPASSWFSLNNFTSSTRTNLWEAYDKVHDKLPKKMDLSVIESPSDCYSVFQKVFKKAK
jgi:hypothetical protein